MRNSVCGTLVLLQHFAQLETLHLAGGRARKLPDRPTPLWALVARERTFAGFGGCPQRSRGVAARRHEQSEPLQAIGVRYGDARRLDDGWQAGGRRFELTGPDPLSRDFHQLIGATLMHEEAFLVANEHIARAKPSILE